MNFDLLNNPSHTYVIAEAGSNWKSSSYANDLKQAKKLIDVAFNSGADAVKFQTYRADTVYAHNAGKSDYLSDSGIDENIEDIFKKHSMPYEMIPELYNYCKQVGISFMSSAFSVNDAKQIDPYVSIHKIASFEINHIPLLDFLATTGKPLIISTGACTFIEIDFVVKYLQKKGCTQLALLQCTSKYPSSLEKLNLSTIPVIKNRYNLPVGFSDHSIDPIIGPMMSLGFGSTIIEKHFTLDKTLPGPDHAFALNPEELSTMINSIRNASQTIGTGEKEILDVEEELRRFATRSIQATKKITKGDILKEGENIEILRPGKQSRGMEARFISEISGKRSKSNYEMGEGILE